jgi:hypothetical protein
MPFFSSTDPGPLLSPLFKKDGTEVEKLGSHTFFYLWIIRVLRRELFLRRDTQSRSQQIMSTPNLALFQFLQIKLYLNIATLFCVCCIAYGSFYI